METSPLMWIVREIIGNDHIVGNMLNVGKYPAKSASVNHYEYVQRDNASQKVAECA